MATVLWKPEINALTQPQPDREQLCRSGADDPKPLLGQAGGCAGAEESIRDREGKTVPEGRCEHSPGF